MSEIYSRFTDHPVTYQIIAGLWYLLYLSKVLVSYESGEVPAIPNIFLTLIVTFAIIVLMLTSYSKGGMEISPSWIIIRIIIAANPPLLAAIVVYRRLKKFRESGASGLDSIGIWILIGVLLVLSGLFFLTALFFITFDPIPNHGWYMLSILTIWSMIGFSLAPLIHKKRENTYLQKIKQGLSKFITLQIFLAFTLIALLLFTYNPVNYTPVSTKYEIHDPNYVGDPVFLQRIEGIAMNFDQNFNGSTGPKIISTNVLNTIRIIATENYGSFFYYSVFVSVNITTNSLVEQNYTILNSDGFQFTITDWDLNFSSNHDLVFQYLGDPFGYGHYVQYVVVLENLEPIFWLSLNNGWENLLPFLR